MGDVNHNLWKMRIALIAIMQLGISLVSIHNLLLGHTESVVALLCVLITLILVCHEVFYHD